MVTLSEINFVPILEQITKYFTDYINKSGIWRLVIDFILLAVLLVGFCYILIKYTNKKAVIVSILIFLLSYVLIITLDLQLLHMIYPYALIIYVVVWMFYYENNIKEMFGEMVKSKNNKTFVTNEEAKEHLIETLLKTVEYLSSRRIGAIITIEKEDSLNLYIEKSIKLESDISFELLTTIFMPGTALHDGAVIIRGKHIMSAAAFYPSTDKNDIPKNYGSRHRAAIGISEVTDAFTIVVSEETGRIATTLGGALTGDVSLDNLKEFLKQNIIVE